MRKFLISVIGAFVALGAIAAGDNTPTSKSYVDVVVAQKQDKISANIIMPAGYTALEYIESTGTQWIDTQQKFMYGDEFYFEYMPMASYSIEDKGYGAGTPLINEITGGGRRINDNVTMYMRQNNYTYSPNLTYSSTLGKKYVEHWEISVEYGVLNSVLSDFNGNVYRLVGAIFPQDYVSGRTVALFRDNIDYTYPSKSRIYRTWLKRADGTMAFDLFPARRDSDGVLGLYDMVTNTFFTNNGTGEFIAGPVIMPGNQVLTNTGTAGEYGTKGIYDANGAYATQTQNLVDAATMNAGVQNAIDSEFRCIEWLDPNDHSSDCLLMQLGGITEYTLPTEYTQLEYIESTGTQYIDTEIYNWNNTIEFELTLSIQQQAAGTRTYFGGWDQWNSSGHGLPGISTYTNYRISTRFVAGGGSSGGVDIGIRNGQVGTIAFKGNSISWSEGSERSFERGNAFTSSTSPVIFAVRGGGNISEHSKFKLYGAKFWLNDTLVRNFIPARRNSDGVLGLYDMVTRQFFTNSGTGEFIAGPVVNLYLPAGN